MSLAPTTLPSVLYMLTPKLFLARRSSNSSFGLKALPFLAMMGLGSWGLAQFLKMPVQMKDARARDKRLGREKFDLSVEHEVSALSPTFGARTHVCSRPDFA